MTKIGSTNLVEMELRSNFGTTFCPLALLIVKKYWLEMMIAKAKTSLNFPVYSDFHKLIFIFRSKSFLMFRKPESSSRMQKIEIIRCHNEKAKIRLGKKATVATSSTATIRSTMIVIRHSIMTNKENH